MRSPASPDPQHSTVASETTDRRERPERTARWSRLPIRLRLAMLYGGTLLIVGGLLLSIVSMLGAQTIRQGGDPPFSLAPGSTVQLTGTPCSGPDAAQSAAPADDVVDRCVHEKRESTLAALRRTSALTLLGLTVIASAFGYAMAGRALAPVGRITGAARRRAHLHDPHTSSRPGQEAEEHGSQVVR
ncbi:hypothetical protein ACFVJI_10000 [Streptomyces sp. NPDC127584]|uniref:hypothetical protein n=1 Tax=Streptomyces sp. NPDC127584 TaxID=3345403 RepID=UPI00363C38ED